MYRSNLIILCKNTFGTDVRVTRNPFSLGDEGIKVTIVLYCNRCFTLGNKCLQMFTRTGEIWNSKNVQNNEIITACQFISFFVLQTATYRENLNSKIAKSINDTSWK